MKIKISSEDSVTSLLAAAAAVENISGTGAVLSENVTVYVPEAGLSEDGKGIRDSELTMVVLPRETGDSEYDVSAYLLRTIRKTIRKHGERLRRMKEENARLKSNTGAARKNGYSTKDSWRLKLGENERLLTRELVAEAILKDIEAAADVRRYTMHKKEADGVLRACIAVQGKTGIYVLPPGAYWFRKLGSGEGPKETDYYEFKELEISGQKRLVFEKLEVKKEEIR